MPDRPHFILIDGHAVAYRAYHALQRANMSTSAGEPTSAVYGFAHKLMDLLAEKPEYIAVSFDRGLSGRDVQYAEYKSTREKMPEDLATQMNRIDELVGAFNIPRLSKDGYEADDVIGTIAHQAEAQGCGILIVTGDRDLLQLLSPHTHVMLPDPKSRTDKVWDVDAFREKYDGLDPAQLIELKGLMGDSSDNIPGVAGMGEKSALKAIVQYGKIERAYENLDALGTRIANVLRDNLDIALLSRELATIQRNVDLKLDLDACRARDFQPEDVLAMFDTLEFGDTTRKKFAALAEDAHAEVAAAIFSAQAEFIPDHEVITTPEALAAMVDALSAASLIAFDTETTSIDKMQADLVGISLSADGTHGYYIPVGHGPSPNPQMNMFEQANTPQQLPLPTVIEALRGPLTHPNIGKVAHNAEYDYVMLLRAGLDVWPIVEDTMLAEFVLDPGSPYLGLKNLARDRLNIKMRDIEALIGKGKKQITMAQADIAAAAEYASADAVVTYRLVEPMRAALDDLKLPQARQLYETLEMPLIPVIAAMEMAGVLVDEDYLRELSSELGHEQAQLTRQIYAAAGTEFNINSTQQLNEILFDRLRLSTSGLKKTKTGGFSLTAGVLEELAGRESHAILPLILAYRSLQKLLSTYIDALPLLINPQTGRVHTSFNQTGTVTGRLSSSAPNLQNIPIRTEEGRRVRRAFIAPPGYLLLSVDYSQIELRILAHYSADETLRQAFIEGQDIHRTTAARVNNIAPEAVTYEQRRMAKAINFGLMYGMGAFRLARDTDLTLSEAEAFITAYFKNFPGVKDYLETTKDFARQNGYVQTLFGRRRYFPELTRDDINQNQRARAEREAINMPIQGTAADILKQAMIDLHARLADAHPKARILLQVHDELVLEAPEDEIEAVRALVVETMQAAGDMLDVPIVADAAQGPNWAALT